MPATRSSSCFHHRHIRLQGILRSYERDHPARAEMQVPRFDAEEMMLYLAHQARTGSLPDAAAPGMEGHQVHCLWHPRCS